MLHRKLLLGLGVSCLALASALVWPEHDGQGAAHAAANPTPRGPRVALLATRPGAELSSLFIVRAGQSDDPVPVATFPHLADATVRAAVLPGVETVLATADTAPTRDASFNASLIRLVPHTPPQVLINQVVHASRPLITRAGRVFVSRGVAGIEVEGQMRLDDLTIDEINVSTGQPHTIHAQNAFLLFLCGEAGREIVLYRVLSDHADIIAVNPDTSEVRTIAKNIPPFARDFSIDAAGQKVVFQNRDALDSHSWVIDQIEIESGQQTRLFSSPNMAMAPVLLPKGSVLYNPEARGLSVLQAPLHVESPLGAGVDLVLTASADERFLGALHTRPSAFSTPFLVDTQDSRAFVLPAPAESRITLAGFFPEEGGAL